MELPAGRMSFCKFGKMSFLQSSMSSMSYIYIYIYSPVFLGGMQGLQEAVASVKEKIQHTQLEALLKRWMSMQEQLEKATSGKGGQWAKDSM